MTAAQIAEAEALAKAWQRTLTFEDGVTSAEPIEIAGFTVWPPSGGIWTRVRTTSLNSPTGERVVVSFAKSVSKSHSFAASVIVKEFDSPLKDLGGSRAWLSSFRDTQEQDLSTGRHRTISFYSTPISLHGAECLRFDAESEDHGRVREAGSVLFMALHMYACVHPQRHAAIMVGFSERLPEGVEPLRLEAEREAFFKSLQFTSSGGLPGSWRPGHGTEGETTVLRSKGFCVSGNCRRSQ